MMASNTSNGSRGGEGSWLPQWLFERPSFTFISLQEELNALPQEERIRAHRDRSGEEDEDIDDSPEFFQMKIHAMDEAIDAIEEKEAYETAVFVNPTYVESDAFRLAFLRAEGFDAVTAAKRMVRYWERKVELFGTENAFKPSVTIMHLKEEDYPALAKAGINVLPLVDASGRGMIYSALSEWEPNINSMIRILWYAFHVILFDPEIGECSQQKGIVFLGGSGRPNFEKIHPFHSMLDLQKFTRHSVFDMTKAIPFHSFTPHFFSPNAFTLSMIEHLLYHFGSKIRKVLSVYDVTQVQSNIAALGNYGIAANAVPTELGGTLQHNYHQWLYDQIFDEFDEMGYDFEDDSWKMEYPHLEKLADHLEEIL